VAEMPHRLHNPCGVWGTLSYDDRFGGLKYDVEPQSVAAWVEAISEDKGAETLRGTTGAAKPLLSKNAVYLSQGVDPEAAVRYIMSRIQEAYELLQKGEATPAQFLELLISAVRFLEKDAGMSLREERSDEPLPSTAGTAKPPLSKRGGAWEHTPEAAVEYLKKHEKEKGGDTYLSKYPFPEKASGAVATLEPLHRVVSETIPRIRGMAKEIGWQLLNNLPDDRAELERLWSAASSLFFEMADTGDEYIKTVSTVAQRTAGQMEMAEQEQQDREKWAELEPAGRRLLEELEPFSKGEEWHQEPARTIELLRKNLDEGFRPRLIHQTEGYVERAQKILQRLQAGEEPGFSYER
jgi:Na+-transporting methylmalonyl-CoA/oxaloacetate decarboxylase gamma subunit